ncbi:glycosyltransferase family 2 protein [Candidatus Pelagibacter bacterium]|nr:glycosyltransferase family 2 protein [Candidatus Pelagibacter bacterium]
MKKISLIIPAKNEKESLGVVLDEIKNYDCVDEILIIVDNIYDNSIQIAEKYDCKIIIQKHSGYGSAIREGFQNAKNEFGCIYNADFSFDPKDFKKFITLSETNDFIFATRYQREAGSDDDDWITLIGNKVFSFMCKNFLKISLTDILYTYVLCNVQKFNSLNFKSKDFRLCIELPFKVSQSKFSYTEFPSYERARYGGEKKVNVIKDGFIILMEVLHSMIKKKF